MKRVEIMQNIIMKKLEPVYGKDTKTTRTGTRVFGNIDKVNWMNVVNPSLSKEEIQVFEEETGTVFPESYKYLLALMNGSFLANLVRIAGQPKMGGLSDEEEYFQPFELQSFQQLYASKKNPESYFVFADSMDLGTIYAISEEDRVLELHLRNKKVLRDLGAMEEWLDLLLKEAVRGLV